MTSCPRDIKGPARRPDATIDPLLAPAAGTTMLLKTCLFAFLCCAAVVLADDEEQPKYHHEAAAPTARLLAFQRTVTKVVVVTQSVSVTTQSLCASLVNVTGACRRRRRGIEEKPIILSFDEEDNFDLYNPTGVQKIETTPVVPLETHRAPRQDALESSAVELDVIGLDSTCQNAVLPRFGFNNLLSLFSVTLQYTVTQNATLVVTTTITSGSKPFFISGCTPNPFAYKTC